MGNKVKYNLKNVHAAKMTETDQEGTPSFSYETPQAIPGAVSISLDAEGESSPFYAGGIVATAIISSIIFGQKLSTLGIIGIILIVAGCVILNLYGTAH